MTPPTWTAVPGSIPTSFLILGPSNLAIAVATGPRAADDATAMAAVPEMIEALRFARELLRSHVMTQEGGSEAVVDRLGFCGGPRAFELVQAALAKAGVA